MKKIILILLLIVVLGAGYFALTEERGVELPKKEEETETPEEVSDKEEVEVPQEEKDKEKTAPPKETEKEEDVAGKVAIIIDDLGYNPSLDKELAEIDNTLTLAILPFLNHTAQVVDTFKNRDNFELILHIPLEPISKDAHEERMAMTDMSRAEIIHFLDEALNEMGEVVDGVNNHKGSKFTSDKESMKWLLEGVKERGLFFVDSYTSGESVVFSLAREMGVPTAKRDIFLDVVDDPQEIREKLYEVEAKARREGAAIAIGHHKENTIRVLKEELPAMEERGIKFVPVSKLLK